MITPMEPVTRQPGARVLGPPQPVRIQGEGRDTGMPSNGVFGASTPGWTTSYFAPHQQGVMSAAEFDWGETIVAQLNTGAAWPSDDVCDAATRDGASACELDVDVAGQLAMAKDVLDAAAHLSGKRECTNIANCFLFPHINIPIVLVFSPCVIFPHCYMAATGKQLCTKDCVCARPWDSCCVDKRAEHDREKSFEQHLGCLGGFAKGLQNTNGGGCFTDNVMTAADEDKIRTNAAAHRLTVRDDAVVFTRAAYEARVVKNFSCRDQYGSSMHGQSIPVAAPIAPVTVSLPPNHVEIEVFKNAELGRDSPLTEILTSFHLADLNPCCFGWCFPIQQELPAFEDHLLVLRAGPCAPAGSEIDDRLPLNTAKVTVACVNLGPRPNVEAVVGALRDAKMNYTPKPEVEAAFEGWYKAKLSRSGSMGGARPVEPPAKTGSTKAHVPLSARFVKCCAHVEKFGLEKFGLATALNLIHTVCVHRLTAPPQHDGDRGPHGAADGDGARRRGPGDRHRRHDGTRPYGGRADPRAALRHPHSAARPEDGRVRGRLLRDQEQVLRHRGFRRPGRAVARSGRARLVS